MLASIKTLRLTLRPIEAADAPAVLEQFSWAVRRTLARPPEPYGPADAKGFIAYAGRLHAEAGGAVMAIDQGSGLIGVVSVEPGKRGPGLGYWLAERFWGRGLVTEAAGALVAAFFVASENDALHSGYIAGNEASARIQARLGFEIVQENLIFSAPWGRELPHVATRLSDARYRSVAGLPA